MKGQSRYMDSLKYHNPNFMKDIHILKERERFVLMERLKGRSLAEVALVTPRAIKGTGVTKERVRQLEARACRKLKYLATNEEDN